MLSLALTNQSLKYISSILALQFKDWVLAFSCWIIDDRNSSKPEAAKSKTLNQRKWFTYGSYLCMEDTRKACAKMWHEPLGANEIIFCCCLFGSWIFYLNLSIELGVGPGIMLGPNIEFVFKSLFCVVFCSFFFLCLNHPMRFTVFHNFVCLYLVQLFFLFSSLSLSHTHTPRDREHCSDLENLHTHTHIHTFFFNFVRKRISNSINKTGGFDWLYWKADFESS